MRTMLLLTLICALSAAAVSEPTATQWQVATVTAVAPHTVQGNDSAKNQYEVSVQVGHTVYVALYTDTKHTGMVRYRKGLSVAVLIEKDTITFNDSLGRANKLPILRREMTTTKK